MYQVVGKIISNNQVVGFVVYNYSSRKLFNATLNECIEEERNATLRNVVVENDGFLVTTDGSFSKLPVYDMRGNPSANNLPVILEKVVNNGVTEGYTLIDKGVYLRLRTQELLNRYKEFFNAKVVEKDGTTFLSAKRGSFMVLDISRNNRKASANVPTGYRKTINGIEYVCSPKDYFIRNKVVYKYHGSDKNIIIPSNITAIDEHAFEACTQLTGVVIPKGVILLGDSVFSCCDKLTNVVLPNSIKEIGNGAFTGCTGLTTISIPSSVKSIGESAFADCIWLSGVSIGRGIESIGDWAFRNCKNMSHIVIYNPDVAEGEHTYENCSGIVEYIDKDMHIKRSRVLFEQVHKSMPVKIGDIAYVFANCENVCQYDASTGQLVCPFEGDRCPYSDSEFYVDCGYNKDYRIFKTKVFSLGAGNNDDRIFFKGIDRTFSSSDFGVKFFLEYPKNLVNKGE